MELVSCLGTGDFGQRADAPNPNANGVDGGPVLVPGVRPYPQAYDGQFFQMDVVSVLAMP